MNGAGRRRQAELAVYRHAASTEGASRPAPRVVFVHGTLDRAAAFLKVARRLPDLELVRYDRRGYGRSLESGEAADLDAMVADLVEVLGGEPAVLVGHSLGGVIALATAEREPPLVLAVAAFEAPMPWVPWWPERSRLEDPLSAGGPEAAASAVERFMRRVIGDERWEQLPRSTQAQRRAEGRALLADLRSVRTRQAYDPAAIGCPVVVGCGTATAHRHRRAAEELAASVRDGELLRIPGASHDAHTSHPDEFAAFVRRAVERASTGR
ncbi:alpha/beta fold hydrolase [Rhabdothermincola sp.]|uniref:alpha/beta fold hydrolase n=1 Tax=Rhabdothermincola sp. TaxID=2820405 RepID=UPI002FE1F344